MNEEDRDALWEAMERAFVDTTTYSRASEDEIERTVERLLAAERERCAVEVERIGQQSRARKANRPDKWELSPEYIANALRGVWPNETRQVSDRSP